MRLLPKFLKKIARFTLNKTAQPFFHAVFFRFFRHQKNAPVVWIADIDNTFADTWPTLVHWPKSETERYLEMPVLKGMYQKLLAAQPNIPILYLTARPYERYFQTQTWLRTQGLKADWGNVVFVATPDEKADLLEKLTPSVGAQKIVYFDDLSYAQELGPVQFYTQTIERVRRLPLEYVDYEALQRLNSAL